MDQTRKLIPNILLLLLQLTWVIDVGYDYWQQPMQNSMPPITRIQARKQALPGVMRVVPEGTYGAWYVKISVEDAGYH